MLAVPVSPGWLPNGEMFVRFSLPGRRQFVLPVPFALHTDPLKPYQISSSIFHINFRVHPFLLFGNTLIGRLIESEIDLVHSTVEMAVNNVPHLVKDAQHAPVRG